jgi:predicted DNA-binding protein
MVRPWVEVSKCQYKQLKRLKEKTGKSVSGIIREAVSHFVRKNTIL